MSRKKSSKNKQTKKCPPVKTKRSEKKKSKKPTTRKKEKPQKNDKKCPPSSAEKFTSKPCVNKSKNKENAKRTVHVEKKSLMCRRYQKFHDNFLSYDEIVAFCEKTKKEHCLKVDLVKIGNSTDGKPIIMVVVAGTPTKQDQDYPKMGVMIAAGLNGTNYMAVSNSLYIIDYLVKNLNCAMLMDYYIIPCCNPDGYAQFFEMNTEEKVDNNGQKSGKCQFRCGNRYGKRRSGNRGNACEEIRSGNRGNLCEEKCQNQQESRVKMDLTNNFPVLLGLRDMREIDTQLFVEKIKSWKENYLCHCPEQLAILRAIYTYQFSIKMFISLQEGGQSISYPFGFCNDESIDVKDLATVAKKGICVMNCRNFQYGSMFKLQGLTYGSLVDFLRVERLPINFLYTMQVNSPKCKSDDVKTQFKTDTKKIVQYGSEIINCIKAMTTAVYKFYSKPLEKKVVESTTKINKNIC